MIEKGFEEKAILGLSICFLALADVLSASAKKLAKTKLIIIIKLIQPAVKSFFLSALSQLAGRPSGLEGGPVSHPDLNDPPLKSGNPSLPKDRGSLGLGQICGWG